MTVDIAFKFWNKKSGRQFHKQDFQFCSLHSQKVRSGLIIAFYLRALTTCSPEYLNEILLSYGYIYPFQLWLNYYSAVFGSEVFEFIIFLFLRFLPANFSFKEWLQKLLITYTLMSPKILMVEYRKNDRYCLVTTTRVNIGDILGAKPVSNTSFYVLTAWPLWASRKYMNVVYVNV